VTLNALVRRGSIVLGTICALCTPGRALADEPARPPPDNPNDPFPEPDIRDGEELPGPLDRRLLLHSKVYEVGTLVYRGVEHDSWSQGVFDVTTGQELRTHKFPFYLLSTRAASIRMYDTKSYGIAFYQDIGGGIAIGPIEPEIHFGAHLVELDAFHGSWNFSLLSPRASAEVGIRIGRARVEVAAYTQYLWRWWGCESQLVRGISIGLQVDQAKMRIP